MLKQETKTKKKTVPFYYLDSTNLQIRECKCLESALADEMEEPTNFSYKTRHLTREEAEKEKIKLIALMKFQVRNYGRTDLKQLLNNNGIEV